ncbi:flagellar FlbD family protein [Halalkalibacter hemicellulosilyticus]|uniref:Flagellar protein FlbD n=1 Tax=Halalkalibacter hemicellulosilyticusJCM 9152 TaxID=1236971 RepID=W4QC34_9BACI|nr:flagellar FlbD family protein [Halalkalibacter hemicellulosilyticus]GAE29253.1 flagellar protein FlbD [Halalkalibacter hemicellulosilyticusJCM 9152]
MIELTRINGKSFYLNVLLIEQMEAFPDTTITLVNGKKIVVKDEIEDVKVLINKQFKSIGLLATYKDVGGA